MREHVVPGWRGGFLENHGLGPREVGWVFAEGLERVGMDGYIDMGGHLGGSFIVGEPRRVRFPVF